MTRLVTLIHTLLLSLLLAPVTASAGDKAWRFGGGNSDITVKKIAVDAAGNQYMAGTFSDSINFSGLGGGSVTTGNPSDIFVTKRNAAGLFQWSYVIAGSNFEELGDMEVDSAGNVFITGSFFSSKVNFTGDSATRTSAFGSDVFVVKLNTSGTFQWKHTSGGTLASCRALQMTVQSNGSIIWIGGWENGDVDFGGGLRSAENFFVLKLNSSGAYADDYVTPMPSGYAFEMTGLEHDTYGNIYFGGYIYNTDSFSFGGIYHTSTDYDLFVVKLNSALDYVLDYVPSGTSSDQLYSMCMDKAGNLYLGAVFEGDMNWGDSTRSAAGTTPCIVKLSGTFSHMYDYPFVVPSTSTRPNALAVDSLNNVYCAGVSDGAIEFGAGPIPFDNDIFVLKLSPGGTYAAGGKISGDDLDEGFSLAVFRSWVYLTGTTSSTTFDADPGPGTHAPMGAGKLFLARLETPTLVLPVKLITFTAGLAQNAVKLQWTTSLQENIVRYTVERSPDGFSYNDIGSVPLAHNRDAPELTYNFTDYQPLQGNNYYRLRIQEIDGADGFSPLRVVNNRSAFSSRVYPTILNREESFFINSPDVDPVIIDINGRNVSYQKYTSENGMTRISFGKDIIPGVYFLYLPAMPEAEVTRIVIN